MLLVRLLAALVAAGTAGFAVLTFVAVGGYGVMWLFMFGDSTWPPAAEAFAQYGLPLISLAIGVIAAALVFQALRPHGKP